MLNNSSPDSVEEVAEILQQLKQEVRYRRYDVDAAQKSPGGKTFGPSWPAALDQVHATARVNPHLPIAWPTWPKGLWPKFVALAQKVVRRLLRWYINPIVEQQNRFNAATVQALEALWQEVARLRGQVEQHDDNSRREGE